MEEPKKKKTIHIGYVIAFIVPILIIVLVVVLWPSGGGGGNVTPTPTSGPTVTATPSSSVTPTTTTPPVGSVTVSIDCPDTIDKSDSRYFHAFVNITSVDNFFAAIYDIAYDPAVLRVQDVKMGNISGVTIRIDEWGYAPANTQGLLRIVNSVPDSAAASGVSGEGYLLDIYFKVMGDPGDSSDISFVEGLGDPVGYLMISNNAYIEIPATWTDGSVIIE
ncbi:MAG: cohesin domain-containing protein [Dehalococcoidia bacterium]|jgi:hypothetical protein